MAVLQSAGEMKYSAIVIRGGHNGLPQRRREIARHTRLDAEAYDEYGKAMIEMARFVKPILNMTPPDPMSLHPRELNKLLFMARRFHALADEDRYNQIQLMTMSA